MREVETWKERETKEEEEEEKGIVERDLNTEK